MADLVELTHAEKARPRQTLAALLQEPEVQAELRLGERDLCTCIESATVLRSRPSCSYSQEACIYQVGPAAAVGKWLVNV